MKKRNLSLSIATIGILIALVFSIISTIQHIRIQKEGFINESYCAISETINCDIVNASSYSEIFKIPIAWWGVAFYSILLFLALGSIFWIKNKKASTSFAWFMSGGGVIFSLYLAYIAIQILGVICIECIGMYIGTMLAWFGLFPSIEIKIRRTPMFIINYIRSIFGKTRVDFKTNFFKYLVFTLFVFIIVTLSYPSIADKNTEDIDSRTSDNMIKAFFLQSGYEIPINAEWPVWGNPKGKVKIVEFSEFQCPYCKVAALNIKPYLYEFRKDVAYYFVNYPLDSSCNKYMTRQMHPNACIAAAAALCANKYGNFWGYHDDVFRNQKMLSKKYLVDLASEYGWDPKEFEGCMADPSINKLIQKDVELADKIHVSGTPTIFINNKKFKHWRDQDLLRKVIKEEIKRSK